MKLDLFHSCLACDRKSPERENVANVFGQSRLFREKSVRQTARVQRYFIRSQNMAELLLNRNFHEVVYKRLEKYVPSFSISLSFYQTNLLLSPQSRYVFDIKKQF